MPPTPPPQGQRPEPHKDHHGIIVVLLIACLGVLIALAGLVAYQMMTPPTIVDVMEDATEEALELADDIADEMAEDELKDGARDEVTATTNFFEPHFNDLPTFEYQIGWHIYFDYHDTGTEGFTSSLTMEPGPIFSCTGCGGERPATISMSNSPVLAFEENGEFTQSVIASIESYSSESGSKELLSEHQSPQGNGVLTSLTVSVNIDAVGEGEYVLQHLIFESEENVVQVTFRDYGDENERSAWNTISNSLDFSEIE